MVISGNYFVQSFYHFYSDVPEGFSLLSLYESDADKVDDSWTYSNEDSKVFIKWLIRNYVTIAIRTVDNDLAAHMIQQEDRLPGMLYVDPKHCRKGLGQLAVSELAHKIKKTVESVYVCTDNEASFKLHGRCGFRKVAEVVVYEFHPK